MLDGEGDRRGAGWPALTFDGRWLLIVDALPWLDETWPPCDLLWSDSGGVYCGVGAWYD